MICHRSGGMILSKRKSSCPVAYFNWGDRVWRHKYSCDVENWWRTWDL